MVSKSDYSEVMVQAAHSVLLEVMRVLGEFCEGLLKIKEKFQSPGHVGPVGVVDFEEITDPEERARIARDVSERAIALIKKLGLS